MSQTQPSGGKNISQCFAKSHGFLKVLWFPLTGKVGYIYIYQNELVEAITKTFNRMLNG